MMKKYKVRKELKPYVTKILFRCYYKFDTEYEKETDTWYIWANCTSDAYHQIVMRAICEKKSKEDGLCYVTWQESKNMFRLNEIRRYHNSNSFVILNAHGEWPEWLM